MVLLSMRLISLTIPKDKFNDVLPYVKNIEKVKNITSFETINDMHINFKARPKDMVDFCLLNNYCDILGGNYGCSKSAGNRRRFWLSGCI
jgi:hypothetical protein